MSAVANEEVKRNYPFIFTVEFKEFISRLLARAGLNERSVSKCTTEDALIVFGTAFIHKSVTSNASLNYEFFEIQGDVIVNSAVVNYITKVRFPQVVNVDWISRLKTRFISKRGLSELAYKEGFRLASPNIATTNDRNSGPFIQISDEYSKFFEEKTERELWRMSKYMSLYEDTLEAFIGALVNVVDKKLSYVDTRWSTKETVVYTAGPGYSIATNFLYHLLSQINVSLDYYQLWDPVSRLKNLYDKQGWNFKRSTGYKEDSRILPNGKKEMIYTFWFNAPIFPNQRPIMVGTATSENKTDAKNTAADKALSTLNKYKIKDEPKKFDVRKNA